MGGWMVINELEAENIRLTKRHNGREKRKREGKKEKENKIMVRPGTREGQGDVLDAELPKLTP